MPRAEVTYRRHTAAEASSTPWSASPPPPEPSIGTPVYALNQAGTEFWKGGLEPFGRDWQEGTANDMLTKGIFLRFPGQWDDGLFSNAMLGGGAYQNVYRWYEGGTGRYLSADPLGLGGSSREGVNLLFAYSEGNPSRFVDELGLWRTKGCNRDQTKTIGDAIRKAKQAIKEPANPCEFCDQSKERMLSSISDSTYYCSGNSAFARRAHKMGPEDCGSIYDDKQQADGATIAMVFYDPDSKPPAPPRPCACLSGTIIHEASHNVLGAHDYPGYSNSAYDIEDRCNACGE
jgi:RHS repeat-associated protein